MRKTNGEVIDMRLLKWVGVLFVFARCFVGA